MAKVLESSSTVLNKSLGPFIGVVDACFRLMKPGRVGDVACP